MLFTTGKGDKVWGVIGRFKSHMLSVAGLGIGESKSRTPSVGGLSLWPQSVGTHLIYIIALV